MTATATAPANKLSAQEREFQLLYNNARAAGIQAVMNTTPRPMVVMDADLSGRPVPGGNRFYVADGVCGFAWITVRPGTSAFAKWLVKNKLGRQSDQGGVRIWVSEFCQSYEKKSAYADAFARVLTAAGIKAYSDGRLD